MVVGTIEIYIYQRKNRKHGVNGSIANHEESLVQADWTEVKDSRKNGLHSSDNQSSVDHKLAQASRSLVGISAVNQ